MSANKGKRNGNWRGGTSEYPNHQIMREHRIIILLHHPLCEICKKSPATQVHHKDFSKTNHNLSNLQAVCNSCHPKRYKDNSGFRKKYGMTMREMSTRINRPYNFVYYWYNFSVTKLDSLLIKD
jgi:hypothetical protein